MSDCYSIYSKIKVIDSKNFVEKSKSFFRNWNIAGLGIEEDCYLSGDETSPRGILGILFAEPFQPYSIYLHPGETDIENGKFEISAGFDASYCWGAMICDWWNEIREYLSKDSTLDIDSDETKENLNNLG